MRRSAVRLEQIYIAYVHFLPPRFPGGKATTIMLYPSLDEYQKMLEKSGWQLKNQAFFNPESNRIFCGSNLVELGEDLKRTRLEHQKGRAELEKREAEIRRLYGKSPELTRRLGSRSSQSQKSSPRRTGITIPSSTTQRSGFLRSSTTNLSTPTFATSSIRRPARTRRTRACPAGAAALGSN